MGAWGTAIFSDDFTMDVKKEYQALISCGVPLKEALDKTMEYFQVGDDDPLFWFAIASVQCRYSILEDDVRAVTLEILDKGGDLDLWDGKDKVKRQEVLSKLREQLIEYDKSREPRKVPKPSVNKAKWKLGDVISYRLINYYNKNNPLYNCYTAMQLAYIERTPVSHIMPELICDEWPHMVLFDYIGREKPSLERLLSRGYKPLVDRHGNNVQDIIFHYHPYRGKIEEYDRAQTAAMLYDIEVLGNCEVGCEIDEDKLAGCSYMYDCLEDVI